MKLAIHGGTPVRTKPFPSWPVRDSKEIDAVVEAVQSGIWGYPQWTVVPAFEEQFAAYHDARHGITFNSGTSALAGALWAAGVQQGDEVIVPAYTFIASATAVLQIGAVPIFCDIEPDSLHIDPNRVERHVTDRTKAVIAVHIGGRSADMTRLKNLCAYRDIKLIEDAAQAWGAEWKNDRVGALGDAGIFSFQSSKNITAGEGGIVLTNDDDIAEYCRSFSNCGRVTGQPRYEHHFIGGNFRLSEIQGALLQAQFERYPELMRLRNENAEYLNDGLSLLPGIHIMNEHECVTGHSYHLFMMRFKSELVEELPKTVFVEALQKEGIPASPGYTIPIYRQPVFEQGAFGACGEHMSGMPNYSRVLLEETEKACTEEAIWLTQNVLLGNAQDMQDIIDGFEKVISSANELV